MTNHQSSGSENLCATVCELMRSMNSDGWTFMTSFNRSKATLSIALLLSCCSTGSASADDLCPAPTPPIAATDDRRMRETDFSAQKVTEAIQYLRDDLPRALSENSSTEDARRSESIAIGYPNVVTTLEGYVLHQDALLRRAERNLAIENGGRLSKTDVTAATARFEAAKRRFCDFLKNAQYVD